MAAQHSTNTDFTSRYKFNAKELDTETGWYYYGARYYNPSTSTWLSVDPLAEKYQSFSPYNYTLNNPINLVDPDGMSVDTDYILLKKDKKDNKGKIIHRKGDIVRADSNDGSEKDPTDRILKTDRNDNVKTKRNGDKKVLLDNIAQNIISDGMNFENKGYAFNFGGTNQPTFDDLRTFLVKFSDKVIHKEIAGYEAIANTTKQKSLWTYMYKNNTRTTSYSKISIRKGVTFTKHFHTHPYGDDTPSDRDLESKRIRKTKGQNIPSVIFYSIGRNKSASKQY